MGFKHLRCTFGYRVVPRIATAGLGVILLLGAVAEAKMGKAPNKVTTGVPQQVEEIRAILEDMQAQLSEMQGGVVQNSAGVEELSAQMKQRMDSTYASSGEVFESVNSVEVTTELCFDTKLVKSLELGGHGALGVGWSDVLELKAIGQVDAVGNFELGLGQVSCIQVPLYSVYWPELEMTPAEGESLHALISNHALGAQATLSTMEFVYNQVIPVAEGAAKVFETVDLALNSTDPDDKKKLLDVGTYTPMMPPMVTKALEVAPAVALDIYLDACTHVAAHPLMTSVDSSYYDWICFLEPDVQLKALQDLKVVIDAIYFPLWCVTHPLACLAGDSPP